MNVANFGPIDDGGPVYGACRPGHLGGGLGDWAAILDDAGVESVICLLSEQEAARWGLPDAYAGEFEAHHVPIRDRHLPAESLILDAIDFLEDRAADGSRAAIHCNAGQGRTGIVGAAWLVRHRGLEPAEAIETVESGPAPRSPREAVRADNASRDELLALLEAVGRR